MEAMSYCKPVNKLCFEYIFLCMLININRYLLIECHTLIHAANVYAQNNYSEAEVCCELPRSCANICD